jgi:hypothetical protein
MSEGVGAHPVVPADHALDEVEQRARVVAGEEDREPGDDRGDQRADGEEEQHDVVGIARSHLMSGRPRSRSCSASGVGEGVELV